MAKQKGVRRAASEYEVEAEEQQAITRALRILEARFQQRNVLNNSQAVKDYLRLQSQGLPHEVFAVMYLDVQTRLIEYEPMFRGTLTRSPVYPREIAKHALGRNAASVILHHNHPSGVCLPSPADETMTLRVKAALKLVEVRVLDHIITSDCGAFSMAESGLLGR